MLECIIIAILFVIIAIVFIFLCVKRTHLKLLGSGTLVLKQALPHIEGTDGTEDKLMLYIPRYDIVSSSAVQLIENLSKILHDMNDVVDVEEPADTRWDYRYLLYKHKLDAPHNRLFIFVHGGDGLKDFVPINPAKVIDGIDKILHADFDAYVSNIISQLANIADVQRAIEEFGQTIEKFKSRQFGFAKIPKSVVPDIEHILPIICTDSVVVDMSPLYTELAKEGIDILTIHYKIDADGGSVVQQVVDAMKAVLPREYSDITLLGHSYGGFIMSQLLAFYPDELNKLNIKSLIVSAGLATEYYSGKGMLCMYNDDRIKDPYVNAEIMGKNITSEDMSYTYNEIMKFAYSFLLPPIQTGDRNERAVIKQKLTDDIAPFKKKYNMSNAFKPSSEWTEDYIDSIIAKQKQNPMPLSLCKQFRPALINIDGTQLYENMCAYLIYGFPFSLHELFIFDTFPHWYDEAKHAIADNVRKYKGHVILINGIEDTNVKYNVEFRSMLLKMNETNKDYTSIAIEKVGHSYIRTPVGVDIVKLIINNDIPTHDIVIRSRINKDADVTDISLYVNRKILPRINPTNHNIDWTVKQDFDTNYWQTSPMVKWLTSYTPIYID